MFCSVKEYTEFNMKRCRLLAGKGHEVISGSQGVAYYLHRDQRMKDNWAAIFAQNWAIKQNLPFYVIVGLNSKHPESPEATRRAIDFSLGGLKEVEEECTRLGIQFHLLSETQLPMFERILGFMKKYTVNGIVCDFSPLKPHKTQIEFLSNEISKMESASLYQVDAHNIIPAWELSFKQEPRAYETRLKVEAKFPEFFTEFPKMKPHPVKTSEVFPETDWEKAKVSVPVDESVPAVDWAEPGSKKCLQRFEKFIKEILEIYGEQRNDPTVDAVSNLSPWLHYGQISAHRVTIEIKKFEKTHSDSVKKFIDELVTWKEMSDNYCFYNQNYDNLKGAPDWAQESLEKHKNDQREYVYTKEQFENSETHDNLWNAAQLQLKMDGKMHGFMRMYWAKKILEWSKSPEDALEIALYLNDHYSLDGADPNGFAGVMWSIAGVHDPPKWGEREVVGKIR